MAQNITLMGASYSAVPAVTLPKTGGGTASFTDVSDTTATAADVASGTYFYTAAGVRTEGTRSGGGGSTEDIIIRSTAYNFPSDITKYVVEQALSYNDIISRVTNHEPIRGLLYRTEIDTVEDPPEYAFRPVYLSFVKAYGDNEGWYCSFSTYRTTSPYYVTKSLHFDANNNLTSVNGDVFA